MWGKAAQSWDCDILNSAPRRLNPTTRWWERGHSLEGLALETMTLLAILRYPDPRLHTVAKPVAQVDARIQQLAQDMLETMYASDGVGLAATQVDVHERLIVMDTSESRDQPVVLINPEIVERSAEMKLGEEGCLSVPQVYDKVERHLWVTVRALDRDGHTFDLKAEGLASVCVQHEMDHLMGKVFVEYLSLLKRDRIKSKMIKRTREELAQMR
jgi:peptide deformylase